MSSTRNQCTQGGLRGELQVKAGVWVLSWSGPSRRVGGEARGNIGKGVRGEVGAEVWWWQWVAHPARHVVCTPAKVRVGHWW